MTFREVLNTALGHIAAKHIACRKCNGLTDCRRLQDIIPEMIRKRNLK